MRLRLLLILALLCYLFGCATYGQDNLFERDAVASAKSKEMIGQTGLATVFYFRERAPFQPLVYTPIPPVYFAVNETLVSILPVGSHVALSLEPGQHKFTRLVIGGDWLFPLSIGRQEVSVKLEAGKTYYVGVVNTFLGERMRSLDAAAGEKIIVSSEFAKLIHNPATVESFVSRLRDADAKKRASSSRNTGTNYLSSIVSASLPTASQVTSFLEGVATVAFAAVLIVAAAAGSSSGSGYAQSFPTQPPTVQISRPAETLGDASLSGRTSGGTLSEIVQSKERLQVRDISSGVSYTIENGRISGTDGSRYHVYGQNIISDTGQTYQVIGNHMYSSDGRSCTKIGINIVCN